MKKAISFVLVALMFVSFLTGCNAYRRTVVTESEREVVDATRGTRGFHHRRDGLITDSSNLNRTARHHEKHKHHHDRVAREHFRYDGDVTDRDGVIGNGVHADRPGTSHVNITDGVTRDVYSTNRHVMERIARDNAIGQDPLWQNIPRTPVNTY